MRVVADSNIVVRTVVSPDGVAGALMQHIRTPHRLVISTEILTEVHKVLTREKIRALHGLGDSAISEFIAALRSGSDVVPLTNLDIIDVIPDDADDNVVVATAVKGQADVICTRDKHFSHDHVRKYCDEHAVRILSDVELLDELRSVQDGDVD